MKTTTIIQNKEHEWILSCLHRGSYITIPFGHATLSGKITQVFYHGDKLFLTIQDDKDWLYRTIEL